MATIHSISINNFRGIKSFKQSFYGKKLICLIGRGDSGKSTILEAISNVLSSSWNLTFYDSDFYNCETANAIVIEATLVDLPDYFINENKYGFHLRMINLSGIIVDDPEQDQGIPALTIRLEVNDDLEPKWTIVNSRPNQEPIQISASARAKLNTYLISDFTDRHFSWNKGNPLNSLLKNEESVENESNNVVINALREAKKEIDKTSFTGLESVVKAITEKAKILGVDISGTNTTIDFKDISIKDNRVCLHDNIYVPFRLKGKGIKRLISIAIQLALTENNGIILIDEIEQGLEPDRVQHLVSRLKEINTGQVFLTTHSRDVSVELDATDFFIMRSGADVLINVSDTLQDCIRKNPEALFANKLIICEGATEIGICRAINEYRISKSKMSSSYQGIRFTDGSGSSFIKYCKGFNELNYPVIVFCDSDIEAINAQKEQLRLLGITIVDCETNNAIEQQIFKDLPWNGIIELVNYRMQQKGISSIKDSFKNNALGEFPDNWEKSDSEAFRSLLGKAATIKKEKTDGTYEDKSWFKRIDHGEFLGSIICKHYDQMGNNHLRMQIDKLSSWMNND